MTILEQLEATEPGLERHYFLADHREEIRRAVALKQFPKTPAWNPEDRWPWLGWGQGTPPPPPALASKRAILESFENLPVRARQQIYRRHRNTILELRETLRREHFGH